MSDDALAGLRAEARAFEKALPPARRKALGQFFTGATVSRLLAHLASRDDTRCILDPMAGTGDLLDAAYGASPQRNSRIRQLHAIEIDIDSAQLCQRRLHHLARCTGPDIRVLPSDAFDPATYAAAETKYDLVIANPPYVRYQSMRGRGETVRRGLRRTASQLLDGNSRAVWSTLIDGYSGLADLSVPSCLLCALFVRPGGRLALVIPDTWRSRSYADVVRYLLLRAFRVEVVVEDSRRGWFPDALVGTHLIVARRLPNETIAVPLSERTAWPDGAWVKVHPEAASNTSLVGFAFPGNQPEAAFASWARAHRFDAPPVGIAAHTFSTRDEWASLRADSRPPNWLQAVEPLGSSFSSPLNATTQPVALPSLGLIPDALRDLMPRHLDLGSFRLLRDFGVHTGQGLRTGCNRFFYVRRVDEPSSESTRVTTSAAFASLTLSVPSAALKPVLHRQAELAALRSPHILTHVLDLRRWALPEDLPAVNAALPIYERAGQYPPRKMPDELADYVRFAAHSPLSATVDGKAVSALSAVRTNVRPARADAPPRFWYMLPDFAPRHVPDAFIPRVIHGCPQTYANPDPKLLIDANFSTLWSDAVHWTTDLLTALLNSAWCRVLMEATGTRLGGGALKLEASHLRKLPLPNLTDEALAQLRSVAHSGAESSQLRVDRIVLGALLPASAAPSDVDAFAATLLGRADQLRRARGGSP